MIVCAACGCPLPITSRSCLNGCSDISLVDWAKGRRPALARKLVDARERKRKEGAKP